jgi:hypothetical protein
MSINSKTTSKAVGSNAGRTLHNPNASATAKALAGSALAQRGATKQSGSVTESLAARVLDSAKYSPQTKALAGSVLAQSNKKR